MIAYVMVGKGGLRSTFCLKQRRSGASWTTSPCSPRCWEAWRWRILSAPSRACHPSRRRGARAGPVDRQSLRTRHHRVDIVLPLSRAGADRQGVQAAEHSLALADELDFFGIAWAVGTELADTFTFLGAWAQVEERVERARAEIDILPRTLPSGYPNAVSARLQLRRGNRAAAEQILAPFPLPSWGPSIFLPALQPLLPSHPPTLNSHSLKVMPTRRTRLPMP